MQQSPRRVKNRAGSPRRSLSSATAGRIFPGAMSRAPRSNDWGFPRWRGYEGAREAAKVRLCDRVGCNQPGNCPAPKSPNSPDRLYFCQPHAAEYNAGWDYFAGLTAEEAAERARKEEQTSSGYRESAYYGWAGSGDGRRSRDEIRALGGLGLSVCAGFR